MKKLTRMALQAGICCHLFAGCDCKSEKHSAGTAKQAAPVLEESHPDHGESEDEVLLTEPMARAALIELVATTQDQRIIETQPSLKEDIPAVTGPDGKEKLIGGFWCDLTEKYFSVALVNKNGKCFGFIQGQFVAESGKWRADVLGDMCLTPAPAGD